MATNENQDMSKRDQHLGRLRERYPDKKFEDDEEIYGQIGEDYDNYEKEIDGYKGREKQLSDMFANDPRSAQFLTELSNGENPVVSMLKHYGPDIKDALDDPEKMQELADAWQQEQERIAKSKQLDDEYAQNLPKSLDELSAYQQETDISDEECDEIITALFEIVRNGVMGKFDKKIFAFARNAIKHDSDVAMATEEGTIAGRNLRVTEKLRKSAKGDGLPSLEGKNGMQRPQRTDDEKSIFDWAKEA